MDPNVKKRIPVLTDHTQFKDLDVQIINEKPALLRISNLLSREECEHIINLAKGKLSPSTLIVGNKEVVNPSRSSRSAFLTRNGELPFTDAVIHRFLTRCSILCGMPVSYFEGMKVVNYQKGQEYQGHHDFFKNHDNFTKDVGDRLLTFFVYLNTLSEEDGGCTYFPRLGVRSKPKAGDAMFWTNLDFDGNYYDDTLHAGEPVLGDTEKWGINVWIREKPYYT